RLAGVAVARTLDFGGADHVYHDAPGPAHRLGLVGEPDVGDHHDVTVVATEVDVVDPEIVPEDGAVGLGAIPLEVLTHRAQRAPRDADAARHVGGGLADGELQHRVGPGLPPPQVVRRDAQRRRRALVEQVGEAGALH